MSRLSCKCNKTYSPVSLLPEIEYSICPSSTIRFVLLPFELLFITRYSLSSTSHSLLVIHYTLLAIHYPLLVIHYTLFVIHYSLFLIHYSLCIIHSYYALHIPGGCFLCNSTCGECGRAIWTLDPRSVSLWLFSRSADHVQNVLYKLWITVAAAFRTYLGEKKLV